MVLTQPAIFFCQPGARPPRFHTTMVLTQRFGAGTYTGGIHSFHTTMVLTQLLPEHSLYSAFLSFHTTMVLTQPPSLRSVDSYSCCFHTTMVLTQLDTLIKNRGDMLKFPYHYGSHATRRVLTLDLNFQIVSIPLWFSRNLQFSRTDLIPSCFHTTMVLTQPKKHSIKASEEEEFPYHYGSHATY
mgnify:FL=1